MQMAAVLGYPCAGVIARPRECAPGLLLWLTVDGWALQETGRGAPGPVRVDFVEGKARHRRLHGGGSGQMVARAVGVGKASRSLQVLDATAGLGQDAFVLASLGCEMHLLERTAVVHLLLADGLARARQTGLPDEQAIVARMTLERANALDWLAQAPVYDATRPDSGVADVIYLDPMFPHRDKSALVKKEMRLFRGLVGDDEDADALLAVALRCARYRVVVKRPRKAPVLAGIKPGLTLEGQSSRYDIYPLRALP